MSAPDFYEPGFVDYFSEGIIPLEDQPKAIDALKELMEMIRTGSVPELAALHVPAAKKKRVDAAQVEKQRRGLLVNYSWQMAQFLRYNRPKARITEAEPYLRCVIDGHEGSTPEQTPAMLLAVAIHKTPGREEEAYRILKDAMEHSDRGAGPVTFLMAQAAVARAMRRINKIEEAEELEGHVINWIVFHPYGFPPSMIRKLVTDDTEPAGAPNAILDDPEIKARLGNQMEMPGMGGMFGSTVITFG